MCYRSSEETLELLLQFKHIETTEAIREQLMSKFSHVMKQFMKEVLRVQTEFDVRSHLWCYIYSYLT
jgi:ribosome-associated translation inhibitor RaiA